MKLADIVSAVRHAAESEFKRAYYNAAAVLSEGELCKLSNSLYAEVYKDDPNAFRDDLDENGEA